MPFDKESASAAGLKGGPNRWKNKDPATMRNNRILLHLSESELEMLDKKAKENKMSRNELIIRAVREYK